MNTTLLQRLKNRMNLARAGIHECEKKIREQEMQRERLRGEVSSLEDVIDEINKATPATPEGGGGAEQGANNGTCEAQGGASSSIELSSATAEGMRS